MISVNIREKETLRKHKKAQKKFKKVMKSLKDLKPESNYEDFKEIFDQNTSHYNLISEPDRKQLFLDFKNEILKVI